MTDTNNAAQPGLTDEEIRSMAHEIWGMRDFGALDFARAIESALLSKLRAPVAESEIAALRKAFQAGWKSNADEPLSDHEESCLLIDWGDYCKDVLKVSLPLASAPVAGEAQAVAWFIDWPDEPELGHYIAESPAANGRSRPLVFADAVPQPSEPVYAYRRKGLDDFVTCDRERFDELSAKPRLFETRIFYAAPQASEAVRHAEDAERWRWATASDGNADKLCSIVLCHGGYQDKINERADFYRAALSAQPGAQRTGGSE